MSLTIGNAPFGTNPGVTNFSRPERVLYFEDSPRWVRCTLGGQTIASSRRAKLLHETGLVPVYYFPMADVSMELLTPTDRTSHCPIKGDARYWSIRTADREARDAAWNYPEPIDGAPTLAEFIAFYWHKLDHWFEEDEEVFVHARDPYTRIDILDSSRRVRVEVNGELIAETRRPRVLFETGLPPRFYIPREDVRTELLTPTETTTRCPYKGTASYWSVKARDEEVVDLVWCYENPVRETARIEGLFCFFNERVDLVIDGELQERPTTKWS